MRLYGWLEARIDTLSSAYEPDGRALGVVRILYGLTIIVWPTRLGWIHGTPEEFVNTANWGLPALVDTLPSLWFTTCLMIAQYVTAAWLIVGWRTKLASVSVVVVSLMSSSLVYLFSKVDHTIFYELVPLFLLAAGWGSRYSIDALTSNRNRETSGFPLVVMSVVLAFGWFTAAIAKVSGGWWHWERHGSWYHVAKDVAAGEREGILAQFALDNLPIVAWKAVDYATIFAEGWVIVAILSPALFRAAVVLLSLFHLSVFLMLDIRFGTYAFLYVPYFLSSPRGWFHTTSSFRAPAAAMMPRLRVARSKPAHRI